MAHFAKIVNGVVENVIVADSAEWCKTYLGGDWVQTSYNTHAGAHTLGGTPLHKNYAGIGYLFDGIGFYSPNPYPSWTLNQDTYLWEAPSPMPLDGKFYSWNEAELAWQELSIE